MVGVRRFDEDGVLDRVAELFWRQGYEATSIQDLEAQTRLGRGSLYNAFGDKAALFRRALARYGATQGPPLQHLAQPDARAGLAALLNAIVARMDQPGRPRGCLFTNTCVQGAEEAGVGPGMATGVRALEDVLAARFEQARAEGQMAPEADVRALARFYSVVIQGLGVSHRVLGDRATLDDTVAAAMLAWPSPT